MYLRRTTAADHLGPPEMGLCFGDTVCCPSATDHGPLTGQKPASVGDTSHLCRTEAARPSVRHDVPVLSIWRRTARGGGVFRPCRAQGCGWMTEMGISAAGTDHRLQHRRHGTRPLRAAPAGGAARADRPTDQGSSDRPDRGGVRGSPGTAV